ncbi:MAG: TonB-dependent receptor [Calditrichaeota bacterium]|nr:TonB-dependent receptor [Calditrichota bacterium]
MKGQFNLKLLFVFVVILTSNNILLSQKNTGSIAGKVVDAETGDPLPGVNVVIEGTLRGAATDLDGAYRIYGLEPGTYNIVATFIGFGKKKIVGIEVKADQVQKLNFTLSMAVIEGQEVVITAKAARNTEASLLKDRQKAIAVSDAISAEAISQSGAENAADAMKQVTGASVVDGKYVYVRGLGDRYTSTQLNGAELPSTNPYKRAGSIDLIPSNLIDNIVTVKSFTPDKPGNFSGGMVNIITKDFPEKLNVKFSASSSFNSQTTFKSDGPISYSGGSKDWLGMDDGSRKLPNFIGHSAPPTIPSTLDPTALNDLAAYSRAFSPQMTPNRIKPPLNQSYSLSIGNQFNIMNKPFGYIASLTYSNSYASYDNGQYNAWNLGSKNATKLTPIFEMNDVKSTHDVLWGGLLKSSYKLNPKNILSLNLIYNVNGESTARYLQGKYDYDLLDRIDDLFQSSNISYNERRLYSLQLNGEHQFDNLLGSQISWQYSKSKSSQNEPDVRYFSRFAMMDKNRVTRYGTFSNIAPTRLFRYLDERSDEATLNVSVPLKSLGISSGTLKFGAFYNQKNRDFSERRFIYGYGSGASSYKGDPDKFFSYQNVGWDSTSQTINGVTYYGYELKLYIRESDRGSNDYVADQNVQAYYAMVDLPLIDRLRFVGGARYEMTGIHLTSMDPTKANGEIATNDLLPSANLIFSLAKNMNLRASATRTLARPNFRELAPYATFDFSAGFTHIGNPSLKRTLINNFDLRWEWFSRPGEIYAVSLFYKDFINPIENAFIVQASNREITWENVDKAQVQGLEFEARKRLDIITPALSNFMFGANFSLVNSKIDISREQLQLMRANNPEISATRELEGQSPFLLNLNLSYDNLEKGFRANLHYNVFGERLSAVNKTGEPFVYEQPVNSLNLTLSKMITHNLRFKVSGKNLLDAKSKKTQVYKGQEYIFQQYTTGRTFSVGLGYSL